jgi:hypothetical protein
MKSIKQQYIDLREGNMSQANFMRNLRMTLPQYVTNVTSYNDSIRILKNKGILSEADLSISKDTVDKMKSVLQGLTANNDEYHRDGYTMGFFEGEGQDEEGKELSEMIDPTQAEEIALAAGSYEAAVDKLEDMGLTPQEADRIATDIYGEDGDVPEEKYNPEDYGGMDHDAYENNLDHDNWLNEAKDEKTKWTNTSSKSMYDAFKEIDKLNGHEVLIGIDYEMEKNPELTKVAAAKIVIKNLKKNSIYYTAQDMSGVEGYEPEYIGGKSADPEAHQMQYLDKNMGNVVDKKRGMQPVKGIEKPKKDADAKKETNKPEKNIQLMSLIAKTVRGMKKMDATGEKMKKIVMKEGMEGQYTFNGYFKGGELDKLKTMIPDAEIDDQVEYGQGAKTTVLSQQHSDEEIKKAVDSVIGMNEDKVASTIFDKNANITKGVNDIAKGKLTKERLKEMIRQEIAGAYGGDDMGAEDGSSYVNN